MSNIEIHKEKQPHLSALYDWTDAFRNWRETFRFDPFARMIPSDWEGQISSPFSPNFDIKETKKAFVFEADVPGMQEKDLEVDVSENRLTVSGKRSQENEEKNETSYRCERSFGSFTRMFTLPGEADLENIGAKLQNGVLSITVQKKNEAKSRRVSIAAE